MGNIVPIIGLALLVGIYWEFYGAGYDPKTISGKRVLITGASSGIGEHLAYHYAKLGARVFITARRSNLLENVANKCKELGAEQIEILPSDLGDPKDRKRVISEVQKRLGGLDHLILNHVAFKTGFWLGTEDNITSLLEDFNVNFVSYVDLASQALPMLTKSKGHIGVVSSILGKFGFVGLTSYATDKFALNGFFSVLRQELRHRKTGVSVTTCIIGPVDTDIVKATEQEKKAMQEAYFGYDFRETPENAAMAIMQGVATRKYEVYFGRIAWVLVTIYNFIPDYFENYFNVIP